MYLIYTNKNTNILGVYEYTLSNFKSKEKHLEVFENNLSKIQNIKPENKQKEFDKLMENLGYFRINFVILQTNKL